MDELATRIFDLLDRNSIEQKDFAKSIGVHPAVVSAWRCGKSKSYRKYVDKIAATFKISADYLLNGEKNPAPSNGSGLTLDDTRYNELSEENRALIDQMIAKLYQAQSDK